MKRLALCRRVCVSAATTLLAGSLAAGTWYADAARPDDTGDGLTPATAKRLISSAVALAEASDDAVRVVKVAPGTYAEGVVSSARGGASRVVLSKPLTLESTDGRAVTFIDGATDASGAYGLGDGAVRGVFVEATAAGSIVRGFTFRNGATRSDTSSANRACVGGAVAFDWSGEATAYVKDCDALDCAAAFGGAFAGVTAIRSRALRCHNEGSGSRGAALYECRAYACVFDSCGSRDSYEERILRGNGPYVNCTAVGNSGSLLRTSGDQRAYNVLSCLATRQEFESEKTGGDYVIAGWDAGKAAIPNFKWVSSGANLYKLLASPLAGDYRIVSGGPADGFGDPQYCQLDWIPEEDRGLDYYGTPFDTTGTSVHCGAVQTTVPDVGGVLIQPRVLPTTGGATATQNLYARTATWPAQHWVSVAADVFAVTNVEAVAPVRFPAAGGFWQTFPESGTLTLVPVVATAQLTVGTGDGAYADIQSAVDAASDAANAFTVITVTPGTYGPVSVAQKNVFLRASGARGETVIHGVTDPDASEANVGCGPQAKRCVTVDPGERLVALAGFTLRGGATGVWDGTTGTETSGESWGDAAKAGGLFVAADKSSGFDMTRVQLLDCDIEDCAGGNAAAVWGGWLQRCAIRGSRQPQYGNAVVRQAILSSCLLARNDFKGNQIVANGTEATCCTILARNAAGEAKDVSSGTSYLQGLVVWGGKFAKAPPTVGSVFFATEGTIAVTSGYVTDDPRLVNPSRDIGTLLAGSSAVGRWDVSQKAASNLKAAWTRLVDDFEGHPVVVTDGKVTAGAFQLPYVPKTVYANAAKADDSGDGLTPETAKRTLAGLAAVANGGDTLCVAAGTYDAGAVEQTEAVRTGTAPFTVKARAFVPNYATLVGAGAEATVIRGGRMADGDGALVRGVLLGTGATLRGVMVADGLCVTNGTLCAAGGTARSDDALAAGVLGDATTVVEDCVLMGNRAWQFGGVVGGTFRRCVFRANWAMGGVASAGSLGVAENSLFAGNRGDSLLADYARLDNCTFLMDNTRVSGNRIGQFGTFAEGAVIRNSALILAPTVSDTPMPTLVNCFLPKVGWMIWNWVVTNGVNATDCLLGDVSVTEAWATGWDGRPAADFAGVDKGATAVAPTGTDLAGAQRVQNIAVDIGCYEYDHLSVYSSAFARRGRATVTATTGTVFAAAEDGRLVLADGGHLTATLTDASDLPWTLVATVTGGRLVVKVNGVVVGELTAAKSRLDLGHLPAGAVLELIAEDGTVERPVLRRAGGLCLIVR